MPTLNVEASNFYISARNNLMLVVLHMADHFVLAWHPCAWPIKANMKLAFIEKGSRSFVCKITDSFESNSGKGMPE